ncbi:hypothetical protein O6H91_03G032600 [Diphasiastrum complanatum]|uniref:Uncharacterized protein n=1 Tax=Diphasiastrum complanatum TaxID=34168 RepID=A0ACC2E594_DIPCM|nr:hypothetical protein O6H91_03G032600 [Diphasiastrum complanatum]
MLYLIDMPPLASIPMIFPQNRTIVSPLRVRCGEISNNGAVVDGGRIRGPVIADLPLDQIRRPLLRTRSNDPEKVKALMQSIANIGLQEPDATDLKHIKDLGSLQSAAK